MARITRVFEVVRFRIHVRFSPIESIEHVYDQLDPLKNIEIIVVSGSLGSSLGDGLEFSLFSMSASASGQF